MKKDNFTCYYEVGECGGCRIGRCDDCKIYGNCNLCFNRKTDIIINIPNDCKKCMWFAKQHKIKHTPVSSASTSQEKKENKENEKR